MWIIAIACTRGIITACQGQTSLVEKLATSWDKIFAALIKIGNNALAELVEEQYIQPTEQTADVT